jgi:N-acetylglutamate synthase-like GNAT family acetyltransferase
MKHFLNPDIVFRKLFASDLEVLINYLEGLSNESKSRFGPHDFSREGIIHFYQDPSLTGFVGLERLTGKIIAYAILKRGMQADDKFRIGSLGYQLDLFNDASLAPSVTDNWQGKNIGNGLMQFILECLPSMQVKRIFLWGGVQETNLKAIAYYQKWGFKQLSIFEHHGNNIDMYLEL